MTESTVTAEEFQWICDSIMKHSIRAIRGALGRWMADTRGTSLTPLVIMDVFADRGVPRVFSRAEAAKHLSDEALRAIVKGGPRELIPAVLVFVEAGLSQCVWLRPIDLEAN